VRAYALREFGSPGSVLELPVPEPEPGQVRVHIKAAGVNPADIGVLNGYYKEMMEHRFPLIPGLDLAGEVEAVGAGVEDWKVGDPVFGGMGKMFWGAGTLAEYTTASATSIARLPAAIDPTFGAALPVPGLSALQSLDPMGLKKGDVILIVGAAGGIGGFAVQLAKAAGARVIGVTREVNRAYVRDLGADEVIDYTSQDVVETVRSAHPEGIAGIVHLAGDKDYLKRLSELVRKGGHIASMLMVADAEELSGRGITALNVLTKTTTAALERLAGLVLDGTIRRPEIKTFPLDKAGEAFKEIQGGHVRGKLVVIP
jgi:NADPH:quinone reductase-like Zn-dependent oxidoreductase